MSAIASVFIARRYRGLLYSLLWIMVFLAAFGAGMGIMLSQVRDQIRLDRNTELNRISDLHKTIGDRLARLNDQSGEGVCTQRIMEVMERVAFLPDGLNKFLYAPGGFVLCGTSGAKFDTPIALGEPDVRNADGLALWINRDLRRITHAAPVGTVAALGDFAVVVPPYDQLNDRMSWLRKELVLIGKDGKVWSIAGSKGLYRELTEGPGVSVGTRPSGLSGVACDVGGTQCVASSVGVFDWMRNWIAVPLFVAGLAAILAWLGANYFLERLDDYWSFDARFGRHLDNIEAVYQPIVDVRTGALSGCEALARWRDLDNSLVTPDKFLGAVESSGRTAEFTQKLVDRTYDDLSRHIPKATPLEVNFNVFGCDLESRTLLPIFEKFLQDRQRFAVAVEIVENQDVHFEVAQRAIQELRDAGIKVYIDDFGIGYSSIERAVTLDVDGVKLDRSFAMAPAHSIPERLLFLILDMLKVSGRQVVVEGVQSMATLEMLRASGNVDFVQGFGISPPLPIEKFAAFVKQGWGNLGAQAKKINVAI